MIRRTVQKMGKQLEQLSEKGVTLNTAFDILSRKAGSIEEIVVVEVMREVYQEVDMHDGISANYADSNTLSARIPSMVLSR